MLDWATAASEELIKIASAAAEAVGVHAKLLEQRDEEIAERRVVVRLERMMLTVLHATTSEENGEVGVIVLIGIAHVAAEENGGAIK